MDSDAFKAVGAFTKAGVVAVAVAVAILAVGFGSMMYIIISAPSPTPAACPGECCPCDAVDAHVVKRWLDRSGQVSLVCNGKWRSFQSVEKNGVLFLFVGDEIGELGDAPASIGELEGDE